MQTIAPNLESMSAELGDVERQSSVGVTEFSRSDRLFAVADARGIELRLLPEIADAATRTPDTTLSQRGADWVRFAPADWDEHALDRLSAWFRVAWRMAGGKG